MVREVRSSRTPQLMSKPTPPGETTPSSTVVAATPPTGNPYPQWKSGMAMEAPTIPGRHATLATCSSASSPPSCSSRAASAKTSPGALMPGRHDWGSRHR